MRITPTTQQEPEPKEDEYTDAVQRHVNKVCKLRWHPVMLTLFTGKRQDIRRLLGDPSVVEMLKVWHLYGTTGQLEQKVWTTRHREYRDMTTLGVLCLEFAIRGVEGHAWNVVLAEANKAVPLLRDVNKNAP